MSIPTIAGRPSRGETFSKLLHHIGECESLCAVMSHIHNTETSIKDQAMANGWLTMSGIMKQIRERYISLAKGTIQ